MGRAVVVFYAALGAVASALVAREPGRYRAGRVGAPRSAADGDPILAIPDLEARLVTALDEAPDDVTALSEELSGLRLSAEMSVLSANQKFYEAFSERSLDKMRALWSDGEDATCAHPGHPLLLGAAAVLESWRALFEGGASPALRCARQRVVLRGAVAWVTCQERAGGDDDGAASLEAVNVFERQGGRWVLVHHAAGPVFVR